MVKFGKAYRINMVIIYNRQESSERIDGAKVFAGSKECGSVRYVPGHHVYYISCNGAKSDHVKITQNNNLQLAEVQVFGK